MSERAVELLDRVLAAIPGAERRDSQREMTDAVDTAFRTGRHVAIQGPTGVGKSLAYLLPAVVAAGDGHRTVVVTSSKALQDQLVQTDLPALRDVLGDRVDFAVLKGRSNYLCAAALHDVVEALAGGPAQQRLEGTEQEPGTAAIDLDDEDQRAELDALIEWSEHTVGGDAAELPAAPSPRVWSAVSVGPGECVGAANCSFAQDCWSERARAAAEQASIVVVNAHLYGAHIQTGRTLLPEHDRVVIDEAHRFEDSIVGSLSIELTQGRLLNLSRVHERNVAGDDKVAAALRAAGLMLDAQLEGLLDGAQQVRLRDGLGSGLTSAVASAVSAADRALNSLRRAARAAGDGSARHRVDRAVRVAEGVLGDAQALLGELGPGSVCWVESTGAARRAVRLTRIDVADTLRSAAWEDDDLVVACCSATLDRGTASRLGLDATYLAVPSPFDFAEQAVLYVPKVAQPSSELWPEQVAEVVAHLIEQLDGRTLALFTSTRMLRETVERCRAALPTHELLAQGEAPNPVLQQRFLAEEHSSLFATASFWTGMSSPGPTCSAVVIDKLPFPVPTDPIVEARSELVGGQRAFMEVSVPAAGLQLAQGVGRLIRTASDRGVVAVCDPRLAEKRYRAELLALLPPMRRMRNADAVDRFIETLGLSKRTGSRPLGDDGSDAGS